MLSVKDQSTTGSPEWQFTYDTQNGNSNLVHDMRSITDPNNAATQISYDGYGRVSQELSSSGGPPTTFGYQFNCQVCDSGSTNGQVTTITFPDGTQDEDIYAEDVLATMVVGNINTGQTWNYNSNFSDTSPTVTSMDPAGNTTTQTSDKFGNVVATTTTPAGSNTSYSSYSAYYAGTDQGVLDVAAPGDPEPTAKLGESADLQ